LSDGARLIGLLSLNQRYYKGELSQSAVSIGHGDTVLRDQLIEDLDRLLPA
jgi:hypothetical protein